MFWGHLPGRGGGRLLLYLAHRCVHTELSRAIYILRDLQTDAGLVIDKDWPGKVEGGILRLPGRDRDSDQYGGIFQLVYLKLLYFCLGGVDRICLHKAVGVCHQQTYQGVVDALQNEQRSFGTDLQEDKLPFALKPDESVGEVDDLTRINDASAEAGVNFYFVF